MNDPIETALDFELAESAGESCPNPDCVRAENHRGKCADAEDFRRALEEARRVDADE